MVKESEKLVKFRNLSSKEAANKWIQKCVKECAASYPLLPGKLPVAVDIGANVGGFCIYAHHHFDKVYAFEPYTPNYNILLQVMDELKMSNIEAYNTAIYGSSDEELSLMAPMEAWSGGIRCGEAAKDINLINLQETTTSISLFDAMEALEIKRINYLKLDCEGSEYSILENFPPSEYYRISMIAMELHGCFGPQRKENLLRFLDEFYSIIPLCINGSWPDWSIPLNELSNFAITDFKSPIVKEESNFFCLNREALQR